MTVRMIKRVGKLGVGVIGKIEYYYCNYLVFPRGNV